MENYHTPVLLEASVKNLLDNKRSGIYVDCTFGGGGHSRELLKNLDINAKLIAFDQDQDVLEHVLYDQRFIFIPHNFKYLKKQLHLYGIDKVDGVFADLGVSSHQFDTPQRGFSTRFDGILDMRMNLNQNLSALEVINNYEEKELKKILFEYGELQSYRKIAKKICDKRNKQLIKTTEQLKDLFDYLPKNKFNKTLAQIFQAIRIEVNDELNSLKKLLLQSQEILNPNGRLVIISYHSLEDRLVKKFFKTGVFEGEPQCDVFGNYKYNFQSVFNKPIVPDLVEIKQNIRSRSAKLRVGKKL